MGYQPLEVMHTTGDARIDHDGVMIPSGEYVAAMYEGYAADMEWNAGEVYLTRPERMPVATWLLSGAHDYTLAEHGAALSSLGSYVGVANELADDLWTRDAMTLEERTIADYEDYVRRNARKEI